MPESSIETLMDSINKLSYAVYICLLPNQNTEYLKQGSQAGLNIGLNFLLFHRASIWELLTCPYTFVLVLQSHLSLLSILEC